MSRSHNSHGSGNSISSSRILHGLVKCNCGKDAVVRTVRNGADAGTKFYGCPMWPNTQCQLYVPIDDKRVVEELQLKLMESNTKVCELEMVQKFNEDRISELVNKNKDLVQEVDFLKAEVWEQKLVATTSITNQKHLAWALFVALLVVVVVVSFLRSFY